MNTTKPMPGDVVELTGKWSIAEVGQWGVINGTVGEFEEEREVTFGCGGQIFRGPNHGFLPPEAPQYVSCSGGPGIWYLPMRLLKPTGRTKTIQCWKWRDVPRACGGVPHTVTVPVWEWDGKGYQI